MARQQAIDVLHVIGALSPGGAERNLFYLAPQFARSKFRYGICCLTERGKFADEVERLGVPVFELGFRKRYAVSTILRLAKMLKEMRVRVVHTHLFTCGVIGRIAAWRARTPVIITHEHGKTLWKKWHHRFFERVAIRRTDLRIAVSTDIMNLRLKHEKTPPSKIRVVFNAVEPADFVVDDARRAAKRKELEIDNSFVIGTVGRLVKAKSYDLLLEVAREVCSRKPEVRFVIVGDGPLRRLLEHTRDSLDLREKVHLLGTRADIPELMAAMDLYIISSRREGLPVALIEAMMAGKPIVATGVGGIPETLAHDRDGIIVAPGSKDALSDAILGLIDDPEKMRRIASNARRKAVVTYSPETVLAEIELIYRELLADKGIAAI
jgi:glycosyltransferase involved in cell wall biosynthesis